MKELFKKLLTDENQVIERVKYCYENRQKLMLTYFNQHCFNIAWENKEYLNLLKNNFEVYMADYGLLFFYSIFFKKVKIFNATDLNKKLFEYFRNMKAKIFFIGGNHSEEEIRELCREKQIQLNGYHNGYDLQIENIQRKIDKNKFNIFIFGVGVPKQELIAKQLVDNCNNAIIICVGNFIEFFFEFDKRAPKFFINNGLEWFYRLIKNPRKFWKRYIIGIPVFSYRFLILRYFKQNEK